MCDFGFARPLNASSALTDYVATRWYRAPELLVSSGNYNTPIDVWAIGCIMGELIDGQPLFPGESEIDQLYCIQKVLGPLTPEHKEAFQKNPHFLGLRFPEITKLDTLEKKYMGKISKIGMSFMKSLLCMNPDDRPTALQALQHPYFERFSDDYARPQTSNGLVKIGYQANKLSLYAANKKTPSVTLGTTTKGRKQRSKTRSSMFISEINEMDSRNKEISRNYNEEVKQKYMMFHITEESDQKHRIKSIKKKIKNYDGKVKFNKFT